MAEADESTTPATPEIKAEQSSGNIVISPPAGELKWRDLRPRTAGELLNLLPQSWRNRSIPALIAMLQRIHPRLGERLRPGRPPVYDIAAITKVIEEAIQMAIDDQLDLFVDRVRGLLDLRHIRVPKDTRLTELCAPIYRRAKGTDELPTNTD
jgi:hypothetical protein